MKNILYLLLALLITACSPINTLDTDALFSVSEDKQVVFAHSNLQYIVSQDKWQFAQYPWSYRGIANLSNPDTLPCFSEEWYSKDNTLADTIDLFYWSANAAILPDLDEVFIDIEFKDWGDYIADENGKWRTLTSGEWEYLFWKRENAKNLYGMAEVNGVGGLVILPDGWVQPNRLNVEFISGWYGYEGTSAYAAHQTFDNRQWQILQQSGAVFLPAAGARDFTYNINTEEWDLVSILEVQNAGYYWSSGIDEHGHIFMFSFAANRISIYASYPLDYEGCSVRLVMDK